MKKKTIKTICISLLVLIATVFVGSYIFINFFAAPIAALDSYETFQNSENGVTNKTNLAKVKKFPNGTWFSKHDPSTKFQIQDSKVRILSNDFDINVSKFSTYTIEKGTSNYRYSAITPGDFLVITTQKNTVKFEIIACTRAYHEFSLLHKNILYQFAIKN